MNLEKASCETVADILTSEQNIPLAAVTLLRGERLLPGLPVTHYIATE